MSEPALVRTAAAWRSQSDRFPGASWALVPTMGYLHAGHLALMAEARRRADRLVVSIFVNPTQFGPHEDLARYPRDLEGDLRKCGAAGADVVFAPEAAELYPPGFQTYVQVEGLSRRWDGEKRPGHFRGVATVVTKLFTLLHPDVAVFGEKDYQQLRIVERLARDLHLGVEIVGLPIVREPDGLAMSSRNGYLSGEERARALALSRGLQSALELARAGERSAERLVDAVRRELRAADVQEDYVALVDPETLEPLSERRPGVAARLLVAGLVGRTRLIDNAPVPA